MVGLGEGQAQLKALCCRLQEDIATNKSQKSTSIEVVHNVAYEMLKGLSRIDTTSIVKQL